MFSVLCFLGALAIIDVQNAVALYAFRHQIAEGLTPEVV